GNADSTLDGGAVVTRVQSYPLTGFLVPCSCESAILGLVDQGNSAYPQHVHVAINTFHIQCRGVGLVSTTVVVFCLVQNQDLAEFFSDGDVRVVYRVTCELQTTTTLLQLERHVQFNKLLNTGQHLVDQHWHFLGYHCHVGD